MASYNRYPSYPALYPRQEPFLMRPSPALPTYYSPYTDPRMLAQWNLFPGKPLPMAPQVLPPKPLKPLVVDGQLTLNDVQEILRVCTFSGQNLKCPVCGKVYKSKVCLTKHLWEHTVYWNQFEGSKNHERVLCIQTALILTKNPAYSGLLVTAPCKKKLKGKASESEELNTVSCTPPPAVSTVPATLKMASASSLEADAQDLLHFTESFRQCSASSPQPPPHRPLSTPHSKPCYSTNGSAPLPTFSANSNTRAMPLTPITPTCRPVPTFTISTPSTSRAAPCYSANSNTMPLTPITPSRPTPRPITSAPLTPITPATPLNCSRRRSFFSTPYTPVLTPPTTTLATPLCSTPLKSLPSSFTPLLNQSTSTAFLNFSPSSSIKPFSSAFTNTRTSSPIKPIPNICVTAPVPSVPVFPNSTYAVLPNTTSAPQTRPVPNCSVTQSPILSVSFANVEWMNRCENKLKVTTTRASRGSPNQSIDSGYNSTDYTRSNGNAYQFTSIDCSQSICSTSDGRDSSEGSDGGKRSGEIFDLCRKAKRSRPGSLESYSDDSNSDGVLEICE